MLTTYNNMNATRKFSNRWDDWKGHRNHLNYIFDDRVLNKTNSKNKAIIFGAGNCDDIDLNFWLDNLSELYLVDIDLPSIEEAIKRQNVNEINRGKLKILGIDVSGLENIGFFNELESMLKNKISVKKIISYIRTTANNLTVINDLSDFYGSFSVVASSAIHTQLVHPHFKKVITDYENLLSSKEKKKLIDEAYYLMSAVVRNYNQLLTNLTQKNGTLFIWVDEVEISAELNNLNLLPRVEKAIIDKDAEFLFSKLIHNYGVKGAVDCNKDLFARFPDFQQNIIDYKYDLIYWLWPYSTFKHFLVNCFIIRM